MNSMAEEVEEGEERSGWVPVRVYSLTNLLRHDLDAILQQRRSHYQWERDWEKETTTTPTAELTAARRQDMARKLAHVLSFSCYAIANTLCLFEESLDAAVHPDRRPRPDSDYWWLWYYCDGRGTHRFVHLSPGRLARLREIRDDAYAQVARVKALINDLHRRYWDPAAEHSVPGMVQRLHRAQLITDAVVLRLRELRRLLRSLIGDDAPAAAGSVRGSRGRSVPPPFRDGATMRPILRRSASVHDLDAASYSLCFTPWKPEHNK